MRVLSSKKDTIHAEAWLNGKKDDKNVLIDVHAGLKNHDLEMTEGGILVKAGTTKNEILAEVGPQLLDITEWLPFCAPKYKISPNINDYLFVPVFTIPSDLPNRNGVAFPLKSLLEWNMDQKRQCYKTFIGAPVHYEHQNENPEEAYGVIADAFLKPLKGYGEDKIWKVMLLLAIDRTKDPILSQRIANGEMNSYSMGAFVDRYSCSYCGEDIGCEHIPHSAPLCFYAIDDTLVFKNMHGFTGFECSSVATPAWSVATSDIILS